MSNIQSYFLNSPPKLTKNSLDEFKKFVIKAGDPLKNLKIIHIAGTNGKGSVAQMLFSIFKKSGYNVGVFTSPHLLNLRERIQTNKGCIKISQLKEIIKQLKKIDPQNKLGFFEKLTLAARLYFSEQKVDFAIIETGLGGRLDPTNVVSNPLITTITSIGWDHMHILGNTLKKIAYEKAGIIKPGIPIIINFKNQVIEQTAKNKGAPLVRTFGKKTTNLIGEHQQKNAALAYKISQILGIDKITISQGLMQVKNPARLEYILPNLLIDGAHNLNGFKILKKYLKTNQKKREKINIFVMLKANKNPSNIKKLFGKIDGIINVNHPFLRPNYLSQTLNAPLISPIKIFEKAKASPEQLFVVFGSLYGLGEFINQLKSHHLYEPSIPC